jgi:ligand-binding SRPBCC domain-containing protein
VQLTKGQIVAIAEYNSVIGLSPSDLFQFLFQEGAWERGMPPEMQAERLEDGPFREGTVIRWRIAFKGFQFTWAIVIESVKTGEKVEIRQKLGVFNSWSLTQTLEDHGNNSTLLKDMVEYDMPMGLLGKLADDLLIRREIRKLMESRHEKIRELVDRRRGNT